MFGSYVTQQAGLRAAQESLGHAQYSTTERFYAGQVDLPKYTIPAFNPKAVNE
jgi:site-specific recombinase XerC